MRLRPLAVLASAILVLGTLTAVVPSYGAAGSSYDAGSATVRLPGVKRVGRLYPSVRPIARGHGYTADYRGVPYGLVAAQKNCVHGRVVATPEAGHLRTFGYDNKDIVASGGTEPRLSAFRFADVEHARKAVRRTNSYLRRCQGTHHADGGYGTTLHRIEAPGSRTVGFHLLRTFGDSETRTTFLMARRGRVVVVTEAVNGEAFPALAPAARLNRVQLDLATG